MINNKIFVFGQELASDWLCAETANELLDEAYEKSKLAAEPDIECILEIFDNVSKAWSDPEYKLRKKAVEILPQLTSFSAEMIEEGLNVVSSICSRKSLEKRLYSEIGSLEALNEGEERPHNNYRLKAQPRGVVLHISTGNVFVDTVDSLISGIITKNANILKMSGTNPVFPVLFLESIKEFDPAGIIWANQAIVAWNGGNRAIEDVLFNGKLTLVFWGERKALDSLKPRLGRQVKLIENEPRYSFAVIEGKCLKPNAPENVVRGLALDVCRWNQQACSSPHVVYVIDKDLKTSHQLIEALFDEMIQVSEELPHGNLSFDEKVEIRKVREIARMMQVRSEGRLVCPEEFDFTLVLEYDPAFKISCLNRTLFIKRVTNIEDLIEQLSPISDYLQTAGLCCSTDFTNIFEHELFNLGVKRITDIGGMTESHEGAPREGYFILRDLVEWVAVEYKNDYQSRIERLLKNLCSSPYYCQLIEEAGGCSYNSFLKLPFLDKDSFYRISPPEANNIPSRPMADTCIDTGLVGWQCAHIPGTIHHVPEEYCYVEIISTKDQSIIEDDTPGEIVVTNLDHKLQPIIRYRTGDLGRWVEIEKCPCGFTGKSFELLGRCDDLIVERTIK